MRKSRNTIPTKEEIEKGLKEMNFDKKHFDMGLRTPEQVAYLRHVLGNFAFDGLGDKIYKLPGGGYTGQGGWDMFQEELKKQFLKSSNEK